MFYFVSSFQVECGAQYDSACDTVIDKRRAGTVVHVEIAPAQLQHDGGLNLVAEQAGHLVITFAPPAPASPRTMTMALGESGMRNLAPATASTQLADCELFRLEG